jgi:hypothetical protein
VELLDVGVEEELELFVGFGGEQDGLGGEAVAEAVAGRLGSAFRGGGAAGLSAVGAGGPDTLLRINFAHITSSLISITAAVNSFGCKLLILIENVGVTEKSAETRFASHTNIYFFSNFQVIEE